VSATTEDERQVGDPAKTPRGWMSLYVVAFALLLAAGLCASLAARTFLENLLVLKLSAAFSLAAIVTAVLAVVLPRRR
jgi:hypothetical protein